MYEFAEAFLRPFSLLSFLTILALLNLWRGRRDTRWRLVLLTVPLVALLLSSTPAAAHLALGSLEWQYPPQVGRPPEAQAIVVLAAGMRFDSFRDQPQLDEDSMLRCLYAADLYQQGPACPVIVSGANAEAESVPSSAKVMAELLGRLGVASSDLVVEAESRTTYENAVKSAEILRGRGLKKVLLVVDAVDMHRAVGCFRKQGVEVFPAPCHYRTNPFHATFFTFVPSPRSSSELSAGVARMGGDGVVCGARQGVSFFALDQSGQSP